MIVYSYVQEGDVNPEVIDPAWRAWPNQSETTGRDDVTMMATQQFIRERGGIPREQAELLITCWTFTDLTPCWETGRPMQIKRTLLKARREEWEPTPEAKALWDSAPDECKQP